MRRGSAMICAIPKTAAKAPRIPNSAVATVNVVMNLVYCRDEPVSGMTGQDGVRSAISRKCNPHREELPWWGRYQVARPRRCPHEREFSLLYSAGHRPVRGDGGTTSDATPPIAFAVLII